MSLFVWLGSALAALTGLRLAALGLLVSAGLSLAEGSAVQAAGAAAAGTAAVLLLAGYIPRRLAAPVVVAAASVIAATAPNAAVFLPAWVSGTVLLAASAPRSRSGRTWALGLVLSDIPVAAAGVWLALGGPLATWLSPMPTGPAVLLALGSVLRVLLPVTPLAVVAAVVGVRAQALVGIVLASQSDLGPFLAVGGALLFGAAGVWSSGLRRDMIQEAGLLALVLSVPIGGTGAVVALLGSTTLVLLVRLAEPAQRSPSSAAAGAARSCSLGSPLWPVSAAVLMAVARDPNPATGLIAAAVIAGLWARTSDRPSPDRTSRAGPALAATALAAGWTAPLLWGQSFWSQGVWPGPLTLAVVGLGAAMGALVGQQPHRLNLPHDPPAPDADVDERGGSWRTTERVAGARWAVAAPVALLIFTALATFCLGWLKGFL